MSDRRRDTVTVLTHRQLQQTEIDRFLGWILLLIDLTLSICIYMNMQNVHIGSDESSIYLFPGSDQERTLMKENKSWANEK